MTEPLKQTSVPLSEERVREYEQMLSTISPTPWGIGRCNDGGDYNGDGWMPQVWPSLGAPIATLCRPGIPERDAADARFIAASPTIVRDLLDGYRALSERVATLEVENEKLRGRVLFLSQFAKPDASTPNPEVPTHV